MLTAEKQMVSMRLSAPEQTEFTAFLEAYQTRFNVVFTTYKEFLLHLIKNNEVCAQTPDQGDVIVVDTIKEEIKSFADREQLPLSMSTEEVVKYALAEKTPPAETPVEKTDEPAENVVNTTSTQTDEDEKEFLKINLDATQKEALELVNTNRNKELSKASLAEETLEDTAKGLMFNSATLCDWSGEFYTGIKGE